MGSTLNYRGRNEKEVTQRETVVKIAKMYYYDEMSQQQIASELGISRSNVSRILKLSRETNVVDIRINDASVRTFEICERLKKRFGLREVVIAPANNDYDVNIANIGFAAAKHLEEELQDNMKIGVTWGSGIYHMIFSLTPIVRANIEIVQLMGGTNWSDLYKYGTQLILNFAEKIGGVARILNSPLVLRNKQVRDMLMEEEALRSHMELARKVEIAIIGIGTNEPSRSTLMASQFISEEDSAKLWENGIRAHVCGRHIDMEGRPANVEFNGRIIGLDLEDLKKIPYVIGVAGGRMKAEPIVAALRGGYLDALITDEKTAVLVDKIASVEPERAEDEAFPGEKAL